MVGECLYIKTQFAVSTIAKGEKFAVLGHQSGMVFTTTYAHNLVVSDGSYFQRLRRFQNTCS